MNLALKYTIFAVLATLANIGSQDLALRIYSADYSIMLSVFVGTGIGLVVKYVLDKRYIFAFQTRDLAHDSRTFMLYTLMGVVTTAVFWGFEFGFQWLFQDKTMRYLGGVIGLAIGYWVKYELDKRYVFR
jgi:putative flippase GtrA